MFVFWLLITLGFIKACLGLCCKSSIGDLGLDIFVDYREVSFDRTTQFCLNLVFFLMLPFAFFRLLHWQRRMAAGAESEPKKTENEDKSTSKIAVSTEHATKTKDYLDIYRDGNDSETQDTKYVLEQLHRSEQSLKSGVYAFSMVSE